MVFYMKDCLNKYIEDDELEKLLANKNSFEVPFLYYLKETIIESNNYSGFTKQNIISSFKIIEHYDYQWLTQNKKRLLNCNDVTEAISATGELRCYGYLLSAFGSKNVRPIPTSKKPTPDFEICGSLNDKIYIEVNTLQMNEDEKKSLKEFLSYKEIDSDKRCIIREHCVAPFGRKNAICITDNVIHKLCQVKANEKQCYNDDVSLLWIDVQDKDMNNISRRAFSTCPVETWNGMLQSNELWYAFYGEKGMPIYENWESVFDYRLISSKMRHNGRFHKDSNSKVSAVIFSFPNSTIIYENPYCENKIPEWFIKGAFSLRWFEYEHSKINFPTQTLLAQLEIDKKIIYAFEKRLNNDENFYGGEK